MKRLSEFSIAILTFALGVLLALVWISCRSSANPQIATDSNSAQSNENGRQAENQNSENDDAPCLRADAPRPKFLVSFGVINSKAIDIPKPEYPEAAKAAKISGVVQVSVIVGETGDVIWARINTGHPILQAAVKKVVCQARFKPQMLSGRPAAVRGIITYKFVLP